ASLIKSAATNSGSAESSAIIMHSDGPYKRPTETPSNWAFIWAATINGPPGPTILSTFLIVSVPKAYAAMHATPFPLNTRRIPKILATARRAASTLPSGLGGTTTWISGTPATIAGTAIVINDEG